MQNVIEVSNLEKRYGPVEALAGISLNVRQGILFGIIGADGAGKSSLLEILATLLEPDGGRVSVLGNDPVKTPDAVRPRIGYMPQRFSLYEDLTVRENILFFADIFGIEKNERLERANRLLKFSHLSAFHNRRARDLSGGMKQKLALSCALIHTPELLILDEPTTGVDPVSRKEFWTILRELNSQGITIIVSTPYMEEAEYCDEILLMHEGRILLNGPPQALLTQNHKARLQDLFFSALEELSAVSGRKP